MRTFAGILTVAAATIAMAGCVQTQSSSRLHVRGSPASNADEEGWVDAPPIPYADQQPMTPALLFDRYGGRPTARQMAFRADWPSTLSMDQLGESIYYRERFMDIQWAGPYGRGGGGWFDQTYRRFDMVREGGAVR